MLLAAALEKELFGCQRNVNGFEQGIARVAATGPDVRERIYLYPTAIGVVVWGFVPEVYAGIGVSKFNALDANFIRVIGLGIEPAFFFGFCFCYHVYQFLDKVKTPLRTGYTELKII